MDSQPFDKEEWVVMKWSLEVVPSPEVGRHFEALLCGSGPDRLSLLPEVDVFGAALVAVVEEDPAALVRASWDVRVVKLFPDDAVFAGIKA